MTSRFAVTIAILVLGSAPASPQWLNHPTPGIPRFADGRPDLSAAVQRTAEGRPDISGVWQFSLGLGYSANIVADLQPSEIEPWADALFRRRLSQLGIDDSSYVGCLPRGPRVSSAAVPCLPT